MTQTRSCSDAIKPSAAKTLFAEIIKCQNIFDGDQARAEHRREAARTALRLAEMLHEGIVGWARDHLLSQVAASDHGGRRLGGKLWGTLKASTRRTVLCELLSLDPILPWAARGELRLALEALELGETQAILKPARRGKHGKAHTLALLRLEALQHVAFRRGSGMKEKDAAQAVADELKCAVDTLLTWEKRLPHDLGKARVSESLEWARERGQTCRDIDAVLFRRKDLVWLRNEIDADYGDEALRSVAKRYLIALKARDG